MIGIQEDHKLFEHLLSSMRAEEPITVTHIFFKKAKKALLDALQWYCIKNRHD